MTILGWIWLIYCRLIWLAYSWEEVTGDWRNLCDSCTKFHALYSLLLKYQCIEIEEEETGGACVRYGGEQKEKSIESFGLKHRNKSKAWNTLM